MDAWEGPGSAIGLDRAHFEAFQHARGLTGYERQTDGSAVLRFERGPTAREPMGVRADGIVVLQTVLIGIESTSGPLPGLAIDGVRTPLRPTRERFGASRWAHAYAIVLPSGRHRVSAGTGPATKAAGRSVDVPAKEGAALELEASDAGIRAANGTVASYVNGCARRGCVVLSCDPGEDGQYALQASSEVIGRSRLVAGPTMSGPVPRDGWAIEVPVTARAVDVSPGSSGRMATLRVRFVVGFEGDEREILERCWTSRS